MATFINTRAVRSCSFGFMQYTPISGDMVCFLLLVCVTSLVFVLFFHSERTVDFKLLLLGVIHEFLSTTEFFWRLGSDHSSSFLDGKGWNFIKYVVIVSFASLSLR